MTTRRLVLSTFAAVAATTAGLATAAPVRPAACPGKAPAKLAHNSWPAAHRKLAPASALRIRLCRYANLGHRPPEALLRARLITTRHLVDALVHDFDQLPGIPPGARSCPADRGGRILALLTYPRGRSVSILVETTGCQDARNGDVVRTASEPRSGSNLLDELARLTRRR